MTGPGASDGAGAAAGRRVLITGGSSGIGLATARRLGDSGARLVLLARGAAGLSDAARELEGARTIPADVRDGPALTAAVAEAGELLGGLDAVVASAGAGTYGPFAECAIDDFEQTIRTTLLGMLNTAHAALPHLEATEGTLVIVGSVAGRLPVPWLSAYAAAKHGVRGFVRSLAAELAAQRRPVRLALVSPGPVDTPFWRRARTPDGRLPPELRGAYRADEVAAEIVRALGGAGPLERTVGGLFGPAIAVDALAPNLVLRLIGPAARLGWRRRERRPPSDDDVFRQPTVAARQAGGLRSRRSLLRLARDQIRGDQS
jgi:NAD(P)-dependent dehydrogenase (short-subunit alcohol dehydrogenase family)